MAGKRRSGNVVKMKRKNSKVTGFFLILFAIYILLQGTLSLTKDHVSIYLCDILHYLRKHKIQVIN